MNGKLFATIAAAATLISVSAGNAAGSDKIVGKIKYSADGSKYYCVYTNKRKVYYKSRQLNLKTGKNWYWKYDKKCNKV